MPFFGNVSIPAPGGYLPDFTVGIDEALARNAALGEAKMKKPKKGFGDFLRAFAGSLGDSLTGNPVYAQQQQQMAEQQRLMEMYERQRQDELADYEAKKRIDQQYSSPDLPGLADEFNWFSQQSPEMQQAIQGYMKQRYPQQFIPPAPVNIPHGATIEGTGGGGPVPGSVEDGYQFKGGNPADPNNWEKVGGPSPGGSGGFPY